MAIKTNESLDQSLVSSGSLIRNNKSLDISESPYKLLRMLTGLSGNQFADRIGISRTYWNDLETGKRTIPSPNVRQKIADACNLDITVVEYLLKNDRSKTGELYQFILSEINCYLERANLG